MIYGDLDSMQRDRLTRRFILYYSKPEAQLSYSWSYDGYAIVAYARIFAMRRSINEKSSGTQVTLAFSLPYIFRNTAVSIYRFHSTCKVR